MKTNRKLTLSREEMKAYGYKVVDTIVDHFDTQHNIPKIRSLQQVEQRWTICS